MSLEPHIHDQSLYDYDTWLDCPSMFSCDEISGDITSPCPADSTTMPMAHPSCLPGRKHLAKSMEGGEESIKQLDSLFPLHRLKSALPYTTDDWAGQPLPTSGQELFELLGECGDRHIEHQAVQIAAEPLLNAEAKSVFPRQKGNARRPLNNGGLSVFTDGLEEELSSPTYEGSLQAYDKGEESVPKSSAEDHLTEGTAIQPTEITASCSIKNATTPADSTAKNPIIADDQTEGDTETRVSIEDQIKNEEEQMKETYSVFRELFLAYTNAEKRAKRSSRKRSFEAYCRSSRLHDEDNPRRYLEWQGDWVDELLKKTEAVNAHLHSRKKKLRGALSRPR